MISEPADAKNGIDIPDIPTPSNVVVAVDPPVLRISAVMFSIICCTSGGKSRGFVVDVMKVAEEREEEREEGIGPKPMEKEKTGSGDEAEERALAEALLVRVAV